MADPIIIDCGGSTRIRRVLRTGFGDIPKLLDIDDLTDALGQPLPGQVLPGTGPLPPLATGSQDIVRHVPTDPFRNLTIMFQDALGNPFTIPVAALPDSFVIESNLGQNVRGDFVQGAGGPYEPDLIITIFSTDTDPLVEAKQLRLDSAPNRGRRRYIVDNAGPIKTITLNDTPPPVYDSSNVEGPPNPVPPTTNPAAVGAGGAVPAAGLPLYVSVVVT